MKSREPEYGYTVRLRPEDRETVRRLAERAHQSEAAIIRWAAVKGMPFIERSLKSMEEALAEADREHEKKCRRQEERRRARFSENQDEPGL